MHIKERAHLSILRLNLDSAADWKSGGVNRHYLIYYRLRDSVFQRLVAIKDPNIPKTINIGDDFVLAPRGHCSMLAKPPDQECNLSDPPPETILDISVELLGADLGGNIVGRYITAFLRENPPFTYEGGLRIRTEGDDGNTSNGVYEEHQPLILKIEELGEYLGRAGLLETDLNKFEQFEGLLTHQEQILKILKECSSLDLAHFFIDSGLCVHCTAGYLSKQLERILYNFPQEQIYDQFYQQFENIYELALLNILLFTGKKTQDGRSTMEQICEGYDLITPEKTLSTRPRRYLSRNLKSKARQIAKIDEHIDHDLVDLLFNPKSEPVDNTELAIFAGCINSLLSDEDVQVVNLAKCLALQPRLDSFKAIAMLRRHEFKKVFERLLKIDGFEQLAEKILGCRIAFSIARELSGYIRASDDSGAMPLRGRPDAFMTRNLPCLTEKGSIRTLDKWYGVISDRFKLFTDWLARNDAALFAELSEMNKKILDTDELHNRNLSCKGAIQDAYAQFLREHQLERLECGVKIFELKTGKLDQERAALSQRRRLLILLFSFYAENRLPQQGLLEWLQSPQNPLPLFSLTEEMLIDQSTLKMLGSLKDYNALSNDSMPATFFPRYNSTDILDEIPGIIAELAPLVFEVTKDLHMYKDRIKALKAQKLQN